MASNLIDVFEAAKLMKLSPISVRRYAQMGRLTGQKMGRDWFFERSVVKKFRPRPPGPVPKKRSA